MVIEATCTATSSMARGGMNVATADGSLLARSGGRGQGHALVPGPAEAATTAETTQVIDPAKNASLLPRSSMALRIEQVTKLGLPKFMSHGRHR
mmetsp:Transcript_37990/g.104457  ORF Transcript_37990/g.104457 Transcript_37990/m.104457 type:complete len:94 (+) Transcript_37990:538-819(+)